MDKEKQIEEMAKVLCQNGFCNLEDWNGCKLQVGEYCSACIRMAERLYNAGYRRQSEPFSCGHEKGSEWISVEERLPEDNGRYLLFDGANIDISWYKKKDAYYSYIWRNNFTHWMPLPEAPKMRKEDEGK